MAVRFNCSGYIVRLALSESHMFFTELVINGLILYPKALVDTVFSSYSSSQGSLIITYELYWGQSSDDNLNKIARQMNKKAQKSLNRIGNFAFAGIVLSTHCNYHTCSN